MGVKSVRIQVRGVDTALISAQMLLCLGLFLKNYFVISTAVPHEFRKFLLRHIASPMRKPIEASRSLEWHCTHPEFGDVCRSFVPTSLLIEACAMMPTTAIA